MPGFFSDEKRVQKPMLKGNQVLNTCSYLGQQLNKGCLKLEQALHTHFLKRRSNKTSILRLKYIISFRSGSSAYCWAPFWHGTCPFKPFLRSMSSCKAKNTGGNSLAVCSWGCDTPRLLLVSRDCLNNSLRHSWNNRRKRVLWFKKHC